MHKTCTCISCFFLFVFGIPIAIALIFLLVVFPARFSISVEEAFVDAFHLANDGHLNSSFNLVIRSYDPSYTQNYQDVKVYILKENQILVGDFYHFVNASYTIKNEAQLSFRLVALNVPLLEESVVEELRSESKKGVLKLSVNMRGVSGFSDVLRESYNSETGTGRLYLQNNGDSWWWELRLQRSS